MSLIIVIVVSFLLTGLLCSESVCFFYRSLFTFTSVYCKKLNTPVILGLTSYYSKRGQNYRKSTFLTPVGAITAIHHSQFNSQVSISLAYSLFICICSCRSLCHPSENQRDHAGCSRAQYGRQWRIRLFQHRATQQVRAYFVFPVQFEQCFVISDRLDVT